MALDGIGGGNRLKANLQPRPAAEPPKAPPPPPPPPPIDRSRFERGSSRNGPSLEGTSTSLLTEDTRDGKVNCLDLAADWLERATPALRARSDLVFLQDTRPGAEGQSGHVVIRQGNGVYDPSSGKSYDNLQAYLREQPHYQQGGMLPATTAAKVFSTPPGSPERQKALADAKVPESLQKMMVADLDAAGGGTAPSGTSSAPPAQTAQPQAPSYTQDQADRDAAALREAMEGGVFGAGTDEEAVFKTLEGKPPEQVNLIRASYKEHYGKDLDKVIRDEMSGADLKKAEALLKGDAAKSEAVAIQAEMDGVFGSSEEILKILEKKSPEERHAIAQQYADMNGGAPAGQSPEDFMLGKLEKELDGDEMKRARNLLGVSQAKTPQEATELEAQALKDGLREDMDGLGTDEDRIFERLEKATPEQRALLRQDPKLLEDLKGELSKEEFERAKGLLDGNTAQADAARLRDTMNGFWGADEEGVRGVLQGKTPEQLEAIKAEYQEQTGKSLEDEIRKWDGPDKDVTLRLLNPPKEGDTKAQAEASAERLHLAMDGAGTDEDAIRTELEGKSKAELDAIAGAYKEKYGKDLRKELDSELDGREQLELLEQDYDLGAIDPNDPNAAQERIRRLRQQQEQEKGFGTWVLDNTQRAFKGESDNDILNRSLTEAEKAVASGDTAKAQRYTGFATDDVKALQASKDSLADGAATAAVVVATGAAVIATGGAATPLAIAGYAALGAGTRALTYGAIQGGAAGAQDLGRQALIGAGEGATAVLPVGRGAGALTGGATRAGATTATRTGATTVAKEAATTGVTTGAKATGSNALKNAAVQGAKEGAAGGAAGGAIDAATQSETWENGFVNGLRNVATSAATNAVVGAVTGAVANPLLEGAATGVRSLRNGVDTPTADVVGAPPRSIDKDPQFKKLDAGTQAQVRKALSGQSKAAQKSLERMVTSPGFSSLSKTEQSKLIGLVGGTTEELAVPARAAMDNLLGDKAFSKATPTQQTDQLRKFLNDGEYLPSVVITPPGTFNTTRAAYKTHGPTTVQGHDFRAGKTQAERYEVEINGKRIPVFIEKNANPALQQHQLDEVAKGLAALPESSRDLVKHVNVNGQPNPDDAFWAQQYNDPNFTSYMTAGDDGVVDVYPMQSLPDQDYLDGTMVHETGHTRSMTEWGGDGDPRWADWQKAAASDGVHVSQYAKNSDLEDYAETLVLYTQVKGTPKEAEVRALMPERFKLLDKMTANSAAPPPTTAGGAPPRMAAPRPGPAGAGQLRPPGFGSFDPSVQKLLSQSLNRLSPTEQQTLRQVFGSDGFARLAAPEQEKLALLLGGTNTQLSKPAREHAAKLIEDGFLDRTQVPAENQADQLRAFLKSTSRKKADKVPPAADLYDSRRAATNYTVPEKPTVAGTTHKFAGGETQADRYDITVGGKTIPVFVAKNQDEALHYKSVEQVAKAIAALPSWARDQLQKVNIEGVRNPQDPKLAEKYKMRDFRTDMGADKDGTLYIFPTKKEVPQEEIDGTLVHEMGHTVSKKRWGPDGTSYWDQWKRASARDGVNASQYANRSEGEDFSETLMLYDQVRGDEQQKAEIRALMPNRFKIIDQLRELKGGE